MRGVSSRSIVDHHNLFQQLWWRPGIAPVHQWHPPHAKTRYQHLSRMECMVLIRALQPSLWKQTITEVRGREDSGRWRSWQLFMKKMISYYKKTGLRCYLWAESCWHWWCGTSCAHHGSLWSGSDRCKEIISLAYLLVNLMIFRQNHPDGF